MIRKSSRNKKQNIKPEKNPFKSFQAIPFEVYLQIFQDLPETTLRNCARVCKTWNRPAAQILYENISFTTYIPRKTVSRFIDQLSGTTNVGSFIRTIKIRPTQCTEISRPDFLKFLRSTPFLKLINLETSIPGDPKEKKYLNYLNSANCQHLEELRMSMRQDAKKRRRYFEVLYNFRKSLKRVDLGYILSTYQIKKGPARSALDYLPEFEKLTHLTINNNRTMDNDPEGGDPHMTVFDVFQTCPSLIGLDFRSRFQQTPKDTHVVDSLTSARQRSTAAVEPHMKKLQNLILALPNINSDSLKTLLSYLPTTTSCLDEMQFFLFGIRSGVWIQEIDQETFHLFGKYLASVKNLVYFKIVHFKDYTPREPILQTSTQTSIDVISLYCPLIDAIAGDKEIAHWNLNIKLENLEECKYDTEVIIKRDKRDMFLSYEVDFVDFYTCLLLKRVNLIRSLISPQSSYRGSDKSFGVYKLNSIKITLWTGNDIIGLLDILNSAVNSCPNLDYIEFSYYHRGRGSHYSRFGCRQSMLFWDNYYTYRYKDFIKVEEDGNAVTSREAIQYGFLSGSQFQAERIRLLANTLPQLKILKVSDCKFEEDDGLNNMSIDIRELANLEELRLHIANVLRRRYNIMLKVEMDNQAIFFEYDIEYYGIDNNKSTMEVWNKYYNSYAFSTITLKCHRKLYELNVSLAIQKDTIYLDWEADSSKN